MDINQIRYACLVAKYGSFSRAADRLFVTQPTLSQQIHKLENDIGYKLFSRSTRTVSLTESGELFIEKAEPLLAMYDNFEKDAYSFKETQKSSLSVGLLTTFFDFGIPHDIENFQTEHPEISLSVEVRPSSDLISSLLSQKFDAIIAYVNQAQLKILNKQIEAHLFATNHINVILHKNNPLAGLDMVPVEKLSDATVFMQEKKSPIDQKVESLLKKSGITPQKIKVRPDITSVLASVSMNQGVCFHSSGTTLEYETDNIVSIPLYPETGMMIALMYLKNTKNDDIIQSFREYLVTDIANNYQLY